MSRASRNARYYARRKERIFLAEERLKTLTEQYQHRMDDFDRRLKTLSEENQSLRAELVAEAQKRLKTQSETDQQVRQSGGRARVEDESLSLESSGTKEESKKEKSQKERKLAASLEFERFWRVYPSRRPYPNSKKAAADKFDVAVRHGADPELLIAAAERYARLCQGRDPQYVVQTTRWFNEKRWEDEIQALRRSEPVRHYPIGMS